MKSATRYTPEEKLSNKLKRRRLRSRNKLDGNETESREYSLDDFPNEVTSDTKEEGGDGRSIEDEGDEEEQKGKRGTSTEYEADDEEEDGGSGTSTNDEDDDKRENKSRHVSHGFHLVRGKMQHGMEDYLTAETREVNGYELGLYGIFDGHSGRAVAEYLQSHLFDNILSEPGFWTKPKSAIKRAYRVTDDEILDRVVGSRGGSTAVSAILIDRETLIIANVGDSRAVLCKKGVAKQITVDHEPRKEKELVEKRGGFVTELPGNVPRVDGQLAMTRAFGDGKLKHHITAEPDVRVIKIDEDTELIILASDGVWKVMSNQEACDYIRKLNDAHEAADKLIKKALSRKSYDDISCIVVMFR